MSDVNMSYSIAVIGPPSAGKTAYLQQLTLGRYDVNYVPTEDATVGYVKKTYKECHKPTMYHVTFACHEMRHLPPTGHTFQGIVVLVDLATPTAKDDLIQYIQEIKNSCTLARTVVYFCASKFDVYLEQLTPLFKMVDRYMFAPEMSSRFACDHGALSTKMGGNIDTAWPWLARQISGVPTLAEYSLT